MKKSFNNQIYDYRERDKKDKNFMLIFGLVILLLGVAIFFIPDTDDAKKDKNLTFEQALNEVIPGLYEILLSVGIDPTDAKDIEQIEDWRLGPRFRFTTNGLNAFVYCNMDRSVRTLKIGSTVSGIDIYEMGYEPWNIENFVIDDNTQSNLIYCAEEAVKACLNYPATADFPLLDWSFRREFNKYTVSSHVEAKNAFGVENEIPFTAEFWIEDGKIRLIYLMVNGSVVQNDTDDYPLPEKKQTGEGLPNTVSENGQIRIIDGWLGEYGELVKLDSQEYCWYHVPVGKYTIYPNVKNCTIYVDKNEIKRNSDGYVEMQNVLTLKMEYGEKQQITIAEDEHICLAYGEDITLTPVE